MPRKTATTPLAETRGGESAPVASAPERGVGTAVPDPEGAETEQARRLFFEKVRSTPGVVRVEPLSRKALGTHAFRVYLRDGDLDAEYAVYHAQREIYGQHPEARLDVEILEESDLPEGMPVIPSAS